MIGGAAVNGLARCIPGVGHAVADLLERLQEKHDTEKEAYEQLKVLQDVLSKGGKCLLDDDAPDALRGILEEFRKYVDDMLVAAGAVKRKRDWFKRLKDDLTSVPSRVTIYMQQLQLYAVQASVEANTEIKALLLSMGADLKEEVSDMKQLLGRFFSPTFKADCPPLREIKELIVGLRTDHQETRDQAMQLLLEFVYSPMQPGDALEVALAFVSFSDDARTKQKGILILQRLLELEEAPTATNEPAALAVATDLPRGFRGNVVAVVLSPLMVLVRDDGVTLCGQLAKELLQSIATNHEALFYEVMEQKLLDDSGEFALLVATSGPVSTMVAIAGRITKKKQFDMIAKAIKDGTGVSQKHVAAERAFLVLMELSNTEEGQCAIAQANGCLVLAKVYLALEQYASISDDVIIDVTSVEVLDALVRFFTNARCRDLFACTFAELEPLIQYLQEFHNRAKDYHFDPDMEWCNRIEQVSKAVETLSLDSKWQSAFLQVHQQDWFKWYSTIDEDREENAPFVSEFSEHGVPEPSGDGALYSLQMVIVRVAGNLLFDLDAGLGYAEGVHSSPTRDYYKWKWDFRAHNPEGIFDRWAERAAIFVPEDETWNPNDNEVLEKMVQLLSQDSTEANGQKERAAYVLWLCCPHVEKIEIKVGKMCEGLELPASMSTMQVFWLTATLVYLISRKRCKQQVKLLQLMRKGICHLLKSQECEQLAFVVRDAVESFDMERLGVDEIELLMTVVQRQEQLGPRNKGLVEESVWCLQKQWPAHKEVIEQGGPAVLNMLDIGEKKRRKKAQRKDKSR